MKYLFILIVTVAISSCGGSDLAKENENLKEQLVLAQQDAQEAQMEAEKAMEMAMEAEKHAHEAQMEAEKQAELAQKALEDCEGKN